MANGRKFHEIKHGAVKLTFFEHDGEFGPYVKVVPAHLYKDDNDVWCLAQSLNGSEREMENLEMAAAEAKQWFLDNPKLAAQTKPEAEAA